MEFNDQLFFNLEKLLIMEVSDISIILGRF